MSLGSKEVDTKNVVLADSRTPSSRSGVAVPDPRRWYALGVIAIAQLMVVLDSSIVNLALPSAKADLGISDANQQWVVTTYTLAFGGLLLLGGRVVPQPVPAGRSRVHPAAGRLRVPAVLRRRHPHGRAGRQPAAQGGATPADGARAAPTQPFLVGAGFLLVAAVVAGLLINIGKAAAAENDPLPHAG